VRCRRFAGWLTAVALLVAAPASGAFAAEATVLSMNGPADIEKTGDRVTGVTTGADTTVLLQVDGIHELVVYQYTQLAIGDLLDVRRGTVRARGTLTIVTANAMVRVGEGELTVAFDQVSGITTVEVTDDEAEVRAPDDRLVTVPAGQMVRVAADGTTSEPAPFVSDVIAAARVSPAGSSQRNLPALVVAIASACVLAGLLVVRRSRGLLFRVSAD
jgi:adhesin HecA-like repeat protein